MEDSKKNATPLLKSLCTQKSLFDESFAGQIIKFLLGDFLSLKIIDAFEFLSVYINLFHIAGKFRFFASGTFDLFSFAVSGLALDLETARAFDSANGL